jgi:transcriptional regulator with XRE-family HTH domain
MEDAGLNENQLAKKLGVSRQAVNEVLNMTTNMTLKSLAKFCVALDRLPVLTLLAPGERFAAGGSAQKERATDEHR